MRAMWFASFRAACWAGFLLYCWVSISKSLANCTWASTRNWCLRWLLLESNKFLISWNNLGGKAYIFNCFQLFIFPNYFRHSYWAVKFNTNFLLKMCGESYLGECTIALPNLKMPGGSRAASRWTSSVLTEPSLLALDCLKGRLLFWFLFSLFFRQAMDVEELLLQIENICARTGWCSTEQVTKEIRKNSRYCRVDRKKNFNEVALSETLNSTWSWLGIALSVNSWFGCQWHSSEKVFLGKVFSGWN